MIPRILTKVMKQSFGEAQRRQFLHEILRVILANTYAFEFA